MDTEKFFIFQLEWSQTDSKLCIVKATSEEAARSKIRCNARYISCYGSVDRIIE